VDRLWDFGGDVRGRESLHDLQGKGEVEGLEGCRFSQLLNCDVEGRYVREKLEGFDRGSSE